MGKRTAEGHAGKEGTGSRGKAYASVLPENLQAVFPVGILFFLAGGVAV